MSGTKRLIEEQDAKAGAAMEIALEAGVLRRCSAHEDCVFEGGEEIETAYKLGNSQISAGKWEGTFESRREMTDFVKEVVDDHMASECPRCAKSRDKD